MQISPCFPRGYLHLRGNACTERGGMTDFWNVNLRQVHASVHVHEKMRCVRERERDLVFLPLSLHRNCVSLIAAVRSAPPFHLRPRVSQPTQQPVHKLYPSPVHGPVFTTALHNKIRKEPPKPHNYTPVRAKWHKTKRKKRQRISFTSCCDLSSVLGANTLNVSQTQSVLPPKNKQPRRRRNIMWSDIRRESPGLHRDTIKCGLTQCLDRGEEDSAGTAPMKGYPWTIRSSLEPPCSWPQHQLVIAEKKNPKKASFLWATLRTANRNADERAFQHCWCRSLLW